MGEASLPTRGGLSPAGGVRSPPGVVLLPTGEAILSLGERRSPAGGACLQQAGCIRHLA